jgi:hypothetical protein
MTSYLSKPSGNARIPAAQLAFVGGKLRNDLHDVVLRAFRDEGLTQADLAQRMAVDKAQVSRWLGAPGNWTIDTAAKLLFAINGSFVAVAALGDDAAAPANFTQPSWMLGKLPPVPASTEGAQGIIVTIPPNRTGAGGYSLGMPDTALSGQPTNQPSVTIRIAAE